MVKVQELATELGVPSSKVLEILDALEVKAKSPSDQITDADAERVRKTFKTIQSSAAQSGKKDFRVRDISTAKSSSVRPRPNLQTSQPPSEQRRVVTRKVIKRVVVRSTGPEAVEEKTPEPPAPPPAPQTPPVPAKAAPPPQAEKAEVASPVQKEPPAARPDVSAPGGKVAEPPAKPKTREEKRQERKEGEKRPPHAEEQPDIRVSGRPPEKYTPVGKDKIKEAGKKKPPKPELPKIPSPQEYLRPKEADLIHSIEKLVADGMRSSIDKDLGRGPDVGEEVQVGKKRKRRRKVIAQPEKGFQKKPTTSARSRSKDLAEDSLFGGAGALRKRGKAPGQKKKEKAEQPARPAGRKIRIGEHMSIRELSAQTGVRSSEIIAFLMNDLDILATINQVVDQEIAGLICDHFGFEYELKKIEQPEDVLKHVEDRPEDLVPRPPVVTVLGHVDHGKTKLLDAIRGTDVVATEAGGITQKIGAFQVSHTFRDNTVRQITFIDTPGHAAFTAMRARGAQVTDVAVLVVAADDGVMPQTLEAIDHARSAGVEIVVAINKIDLPEANPELVKQQLSQHGLVPEEWGGQVIMVPVSAKKKLNIEELLEQVLIVADILDLKGNPKAPVEGTIIEARLDRGRGALATVLVQRGTLRVGDYVVAGRSWGRVRQMTDEDGHEIAEAPPSTPVLISGLNAVPEAGDKLHQVDDEKTAREIYEKREMEYRQGRLRMVNTISLEDFYEQMRKGGTKELNIILKADLQGSIEAIRGQLERLGTDEVSVKFIHTAVGNVTDSDIMLALASKAIIIGFNVVASPEIRRQAAMEGVDIRTYNIIYKVVDDIRAALEGMLEPIYEERVTAKAEVKQIFKRTGKMVVGGLMVVEGRLVRGARIRVMREGAEIADTTVASLKRFKDDVNEVEAGLECGIAIEGFNDLKEGDLIVAFEVVKILRTLEPASRQDAS